MCRLSVLSGSDIGEGDLRNNKDEIIWDPPDTGAMVTGSNQRRQIFFLPFFWGASWLFSNSTLASLSIPSLQLSPFIFTYCFKLYLK